MELKFEAAISGRTAAVWRFLALLGRCRHLRYFRFGRARTLVNRMPDECKISIEVNPKVVLGKPIIRGTSRYPARARSGAS